MGIIMPGPFEDTAHGPDAIHLDITFPKGFYIMQPHRTIWKFPINLEALALHGTSSMSIELPMNSKYLVTGAQGNEIVVWYEVSPKAQKETRKLYVVGTGQNVPDGTCYLGTAFIGAYVWHVYEKRA